MIVSTREWIGLAIAPLLAAPIAALGTWLLLPPRGNMTIPALVTALVITIVGAMPVHVSFRQQRRERLTQYLVAGALLGMSPFLIYCALAIPGLTITSFSRPLSWSEIPIWNLSALLAIGAFSGAAGAALFWALAVQVRHGTAT